MCSHGAWEGWERASDPLQLELEIVMKLPCLCCELDPSLYSKSLQAQSWAVCGCRPQFEPFLHTDPHTGPVGITVSFTGVLVPLLTHLAPAEGKGPENGNLLNLGLESRPCLINHREGLSENTRRRRSEQVSWRLTIKCAFVSYLYGFILSVWIWCLNLVNECKSMCPSKWF